MGEEFTLKRETEMGRLFNMTITCRSTGISCLPLSILLLSGCVNLTGIQDFAQASAESAAFHGISDDFVATLERRAVMAPDGGDSSFAAVLQKRRELKERMDAAQRVLVDYLTAIESLAAGELANYNHELAALEKSVRAARPSKHLDLQPYRAGAGLIGRVFTERYQRTTLRRIIPAADDSVRESLERLKAIASDEYGLSIQNERDLSELHFARLIASTGGEHPDTQSTLAALVLVDRRRDFQRRMESIRHYTLILDRISAGHDEIVRNLPRISSTAVREQLLLYAREIKHLHRSIE